MQMIKHPEFDRALEGSGGPQTGSDRQYGGWCHRWLGHGVSPFTMRSSVVAGLGPKDVREWSHATPTLCGPSMPYEAAVPWCRVLAGFGAECGAAIARKSGR